MCVFDSLVIGTLRNDDDANPDMYVTCHLSFIVPSVHTSCLIVSYKL